MEPKIFTSLIFLLGSMQGFYCEERLDQSAAEVRKPGEQIKLSCTGFEFDMTRYFMHWVRQKAGGPLEWIGRMNSGSGSSLVADSLKGQFTLTEDVGTSTQYLEAVSLKMNDTAVYYCARDTVSVVSVTAVQKPQAGKTSTRALLFKRVMR
uniref:Immunoglobulin heavy variable 2-3 n=1 Tax=Paramormyrops kingsleyae TaxID=1676925 RepID=A0A3B3RR00_9TELE